MSIDEMSAGREMDMLIASKVMGWTDVEKRGPYNYSGDAACAEYYQYGGKPPAEYAERTRTFFGSVPNYSTDIAAAWEVVEKCGLAPVLFKDVGWVCASGWLREDVSGVSVHLQGRVMAIAPTAPLAICRAALKTVKA